MMLLLRKYWLYLLLALLLLILVLALLSMKQKPPALAIASSTPPGGITSADIFDPVTVTFTNPVDPNLLTVTSSPDENWIIKPKNTTTIELSHKLAFSPSTLYTLTFSDESSSTTLSFTTQKSQGDPRLLQTINEQMNIDYPLGKFTPYETSLYRVVYRSPLTLEITLKNQNVSQEQAITQIKTWVTSHGGDASLHKYTVILPQ